MSVSALIPVSSDVSKDQALEDSFGMCRSWGNIQVEAHRLDEGLSANVSVARAFRYHALLRNTRIRAYIWIKCASKLRLRLRRSASAK